MALIPHYNLIDIEKQVSDLLVDCAAFAFQDINQRIAYFSALFLGCPYLSGALGEGYSGRFDQNPLFRVDAFDCLTYVNTVLALAFANELSEFKRYMLALNYYDSEPCYLKRFHFMSLDWNRQNQQANFLRDITTTLVNEAGQPFFKTAITDINKAGWLKKRSIEDLKLLSTQPSDAEELLKALHDAADQFVPQRVSMNYLPLTAFFPDKKSEQTRLFEQIPHASIIEIVRPAWDLSEKIGTKLHVSHLGFALRIEGVLMFRHATSQAKQVVQVPLSDYLYGCLDSPTIKGIAVLTQTLKRT